MRIFIEKKDLQGLQWRIPEKFRLVSATWDLYLRESPKEPTVLLDHFRGKSYPKES